MRIFAEFDRLERLVADLPADSPVRPLIGNRIQSFAWLLADDRRSCEGSHGIADDLASKSDDELFDFIESQL